MVEGTLFLFYERARITILLIRFQWLGRTNLRDCHLIDWVLGFDVIRRIACIDGFIAMLCWDQSMGPSCCMMQNTRFDINYRMAYTKSVDDGTSFIWMYITIPGFQRHPL